MKVRPLIIGDEAKAKIAKVRAYAEQNVISLNEVIRLLGQTERAVGDDERRVCHLEVGFRVVFSLEEQPSGLCRHLSVSVTGDKYPNEHAVELLAREFGFEQPKEQWLTWLEEHVRAVNVVELANPTTKHEDKQTEKE